MIYFVVAILIIVIILLSIYVYKESNGYHVVKYSFHDNRLKKDKTSFVFLSDLHNKQYGKENCDLFDEIVKLCPDFIVLGGDMITSCLGKWSDYTDTLSFIKRLSEKYPVYYGMGNHEDRLNRRKDKFPINAYERLVESLKKMNAPLLDDDTVCIDDMGICIYGLNLDHDYYRKVITRRIPKEYLKNKLGDPKEDLYNILIAHNPEHFISYVSWGADLILSGHVHGGIIRLPLLGGVVSPALKIFPKYDGGLFNENSSSMVLSRGIGTHTIPIRVNNKAELIFIELYRE